MERIAPIFAVHDLDVAMEHYQRLGFTVRAYAGGGYGFASRGGVEIHLGVVPGDDHRTSSAYLFVNDADELAAAWRSAGAEVHWLAGALDPQIGPALSVAMTHRAAQWSFVVEGAPGLRWPK